MFDWRRKEIEEEKLRKTAKVVAEPTSKKFEVKPKQTMPDFLDEELRSRIIMESLNF